MDKPLHREQKPWPDLPEILEYYKTCVLPADPIQLSGHETITDAALFINAHIHTCIANDGKPAYRPYLNRLIILKQFLSNNQ